MRKRYSEVKNKNKGILAVDVFDRHIGKPVDNAAVKIFHHSEGEELTNQIDEQLTNSSGQIVEITVDTPDIEFSMAPQTKNRPYSEYDVEVSAEGMRGIVIKGVQALPDVSSLQQVNMSPLTGQVLQPELIVIKPHTLWGEYEPKIPEEETKVLPQSTGFRILDEPVIPEYIIVHDGTPSNNMAADYWITYKEYIKNVVSSKVYATWPENAIRANVLAVISFVLNRVYSEWYRNKGKNYSVTSSAAHDHAFFYGRNTYKEISQIVDEVFDNYITRPESKQPLCCQCCDGIKNSGAGQLKLWESRELGDKGYTSMKILKKYYGESICLERAKKVVWTHIAYPGYPLRMGSSGADVREIQQMLNAVSRRYSCIAELVPDGIFGKKTEQSVKAFQRVFRLTADGIVGKATWYKICEVYMSIIKQI